jgi:hypothetical protein
MSRIRLTNQTKPITPQAGESVYFVDSIAKIACLLDESGRVSAYSSNAAIAAQGPGFAADTYVADSSLLIPSFGAQARTQVRWKISVSKTAAGVAGPAFIIRIGAAGAIADAARLTLTGPAQTAAADVGVYEIITTMRNVGLAGVLQGTLQLNHNLAATGFANNASSIVEGSSAAFDNSALGGLFIGLSINAGAAAAWTITQVQAEAIW